MTPQMFVALVSHFSRFGFLAVIVLLLGSVTFRCVVLPRSRIPDDLNAAGAHAAARLACTAALILLPFLVARLAVQVQGLRMSGDPWSPVAGALLGGTSWGLVRLIQLGPTAVAIVSFAAAARDRKVAWAFAGIATITLATTLAFR
jgi:hypothetical protein